MTRTTLLLRRSQIAKLATTHDYLACLRAALTHRACRDYSIPAAAHIEALDGTVHVKSAVRVGSRPKLAIKVNANHPSNVAIGAPTIQGFIALLDAENGALLALMDSIEITARRTAAATALAATHLARGDASVLGVIGCGAQARYHLEALMNVFAMSEVRCFDMRPERSAAFAATAQAMKVRGVCTADPRDAAAHADIVVTLTTSTAPLLGLADIRPGTFVAGVGADNPKKNELAPDLLHASRVVVDLLAQSSSMGDLHHAIRAGAMSIADVHAELFQVVSGLAPGRTDPSQRFVFDSTGIALQDLAAAEMIFERACSAGNVESVTLNDVESANA